MESSNSTLSNGKKHQMELVFKCVINVSTQKIADFIKSNEISWVNPRIDDASYPYINSFSGKWNVEVLRLRKKLKFKDIVHFVKKDGWQPASVYHLLELLKSEVGNNLTGNYMAPGSLYIDDFEYPGCVVVYVDKTKIEIGLGNWRGAKIGGYDVVRIKRSENSQS